jgi:hypothetical protein
MSEELFQLFIIRGVLLIVLRFSTPLQQRSAGRIWAVALKYKKIGRWEDV